MGDLGGILIVFIVTLIGYKILKSWKKVLVGLAIACVIVVPSIREGAISVIQSIIGMLPFEQIENAVESIVDSF